MLLSGNTLGSAMPANARNTLAPRWQAWFLGACVLWFSPILLAAAKEKKVSADKLAPAFKDVSYGPHARNVLNLWQAQGETPRPVVIEIHGGGWAKGAKAEFLPANDGFLAAGISVVTISYRLTDTDILPAPVYDAARAVQFVRSKATEWNLDKNKLALTGGSAGGCSSLWLALHDDLANPASADPVERESTKPACAAVMNAQSCLDPAWIAANIGPKATRHGMVYRSFGAASADEMLQTPDKFRARVAEFSPIQHLDAHDPPLFLQYGPDLTVPADSASHGIHHPMFGVKLKEKADAAGVECCLFIPGRGDVPYQTTVDFIKAKLLAPQ